MCGIIGIASNKSVTSNIIQSLKKLEYRGYDSAGIATIVNGNIDEKKLRDYLSKNTQLHPSVFLIKKLDKFPLNRNYKISYDDKNLN